MSNGSEAITLETVSITVESEGITIDPEAITVKIGSEPDGLETIPVE
jgi:hypothetical protein